MPVYSYRCTSHGEFDSIRSTEQRNERALCPRCHRVSARHYTVTPIIYKTDGFFSIDSGKRFESQLSKGGKEKFQKAKAEGKV